MVRQAARRAGKNPAVSDATHTLGMPAARLHRRDLYHLSDLAAVATELQNLIHHCQFLIVVEVYKHAPRRRRAALAGHAPSYLLLVALTGIEPGIARVHGNNLLRGHPRAKYQRQRNGANPQDSKQKLFVHRHLRAVFGILGSLGCEGSSQKFPCPSMVQAQSVT